MIKFNTTLGVPELDYTTGLIKYINFLIFQYFQKILLRRHSPTSPLKFLPSGTQIGPAILEPIVLKRQDLRTPWDPHRGLRL